MTTPTKMPMNILGLSTLLLVAASPALAQIRPPDSVQATSQSRWAQSDLCIKQANEKYPNTNWTSLHNRDLYVDDCLARHHLPKRAHLVQDTMPK
ncbi:MAG TPA: hypothetical protein VL574_04400 [Stellaceae bacterium]|jgi:hypothetical protein|nr:hypothetical protein [Stellaceae bacterium]